MDFVNMTLTGELDTGASYIHFDLYQPPTANRTAFQTALTKAIARIESLIPRFGLRNLRVGLPGATQYQLCTAVEWVAT